MKSLGPVLIALAVAVVAVVTWLIVRDAGLDQRVEDPVSTGTEEVVDDRKFAKGEIPAVDWSGVLNDRPVNLLDLNRGQKRLYPGGVPKVVAELEALTDGRTPDSANTIALKQKLLVLIEEIGAMSDEEKQRLADYFRNSENPALKYHLMIAFRSRFAEPFIEPVAEYYDAEPVLVGDTLQYMAGRSNAAVKAIESLLERAVDPAEREVLLARISFVGNPTAEKTLMAAFQRGGASGDRRMAVAGLARMQSESAAAALENLIDGEFEEAYYSPTSRRPSSESLKDLRAHAVLGVLLNSQEKGVNRLLDRAFDRDDEVSSYVTEFFGGVQDPKYLGRVVDLAVKKGQLTPGLMAYISNHAKPSDRTQVERLVNLKMDEGRRQGLGWLIDRLR